MISIKIGVADIRAEPRFESERLTQVIYGEKLTLLENLGEYSKVLTLEDITGYIKSQLLIETGEKRYKLKSFHDAGILKFPFGSLLNDEDIKKYNIPIKKITEINDYNYSVTELAMKFLGVPYLWGGTSDFGFDCSGFVQTLYKFVGKLLPRNSSQQRDFTTTISDINDAIPGDLIFFKGHVALYLGNGKIIHANGHLASVSIDDLFDNSEYSKYLWSIFQKVGRVEKSLL